MCESNGCALIFPREIEVVPAGTTLNSMSARAKNAEYQRYADIYDLKFIFDDDIPQIGFFTVPYVDVFARDSTGGLFGTIGETTSISAVAPICYISDSKECFLIADSLKDFLQMLESGRDWRTTMISNRDISFFQSKADAEQSFEFVDICRESPYID
jgi:hypothetical protein